MRIQYLKKKNFGNIKILSQKILIKNLSKDLIVESIIVNFINSCNRTFTTDLQLYKSCKMKGVIKMEDAFKSRIYFNDSIFNKILNANAENTYLNTVFKQIDHVNIHTKKKMNQKEIYYSLPKSFQEYFTNQWEIKELNQLYATMGYTKP